MPLKFFLKLVLKFGPFVVGVALQPPLKFFDGKLQMNVRLCCSFIFLSLVSSIL